MLLLSSQFKSGKSLGYGIVFNHTLCMLMEWWISFVLLLINRQICIKVRGAWLCGASREAAIFNYRKSLRVHQQFDIERLLTFSNDNGRILMFARPADINWTKHPMGKLKCNMDATFTSNKVIGICYAPTLAV